MISKLDKPMNRFILLVVILTAFSSLDFAQTRMSGMAVELIDGKTVTVALPTGRVNVELQYIEVPDESQPFYQTVRDHLRTLVVGKPVSFRLGGFSGDRMAGDLNLNNVDIARQMVRDGAAWHIPREKSGQDEAGAALYAEAEIAAKNEKRGVWSVAGLKPPSMVREEKQAESVRATDAENKRIADAKKAADQADWEKRKPKPAPMQVTQQMWNEAWLDVTVNQEKQNYGLYPYSQKLEGVDVGVVITSPEMVYLYSKDSRQKIACRAVYGTATKDDGKEYSIAILGFQSVSEGLNLTKNKNSLSIIADGQRIPVSGLLGIFKYEYFGVDERFAYSISKSDFAKLAGAKVVEIKIDNYKGKFTPASVALFKQLSDVMR